MDSDLLFTRKNTYELVGSCAFVRSTRPLLMLPDLIFRLITDEDEALKIYLWSFFNIENVKVMVRKLASGAAGSMPNISKARLLSLAIPIPKYELIKQYSEIVNNIWTQQDNLKLTLENINHNFESLMQKAFNGELNLKNKVA